MGNDGGSIPDRRDLVRTKAKAEQADKANQVRAMWFFCALSKRPLQEPVVSCPLGKLYNKDALLEFLLDRASFGDGEEICGHIRSLKDVKVLKLTPNPTKTTTPDSSSDSAPTRAPFVCPLNLKEMNGVQPFVYLATCGCVFSQGGLKAVSRSAPSKTPPTEVPVDAGKEAGSEQAKDLDLCPQCGAKYDRASDVRMLNPPVEVEEQMRAAMEARRAAEPVKTKGKGKKRKAAADAAAEPAVKKQALPSTNPSIAAASRGVAASLAEEEARRKAGMSDAVKSLYSSSDGPKRKETFMTMGTFTRYA